MVLKSLISLNLFLSKADYLLAIQLFVATYLVRALGLGVVSKNVRKERDNQPKYVLAWNVFF